LIPAWADVRGQQKRRDGSHGAYQNGKASKMRGMSSFGIVPWLWISTATCSGIACQDACVLEPGRRAARHWRRDSRWPATPLRCFSASPVIRGPKN
jgi:hypothetical protein